jgi:uncharacterized protein YjbK
MLRPPSRIRLHPWVRRTAEPVASPPQTVSSERELKYRIPDAAAFERIVQAASPQSPPVPLVQRTHVFDTPDRRLFDAGYRLRLREEGGLWILTAKGPQADGDEAAQHQPEVEAPVLAEAARAIVQGLDSPLIALALSPTLREADRTWAQQMLGQFGALPLEHVGIFVNERMRIPWRQSGAPFQAMLELDRTVFPGGKVDFELEVELPAQVQSGQVDAVIRRWLEDAGIAPQRSSGKIKRFFQALDDQLQDTFS